MENSPRLGLPYLDAQQAMKHVTHNEALRMLDALVQPVILGSALTSPPASPEDGDSYIVAEGGSGAWSGQDNAIATYQGGAWLFHTPAAGWLAYDADAAEHVVFTSAGWQGFGGHGGATLDFFGIHTDADASNRLALAADASLFSHDGSDHRLKVNKASATDTASVLFQSDYSGRAEFGLCGDDDWHVKVSPDGSTWYEAFHVDKDTGNIGVNEAGAIVPLDVFGQCIISPNPTPTNESSSYYLQVTNNAGNAAMKFTAGAAGTCYFGLGSPTSALGSGIEFANSLGRLGFRNGALGLTISNSQAVAFPGISTTASAANAFLDSANGNNLLRSTSSLKYKKDVEPLEPAYCEALMTLEPIWYRSKAEADNPAWSWYGFAAEDVAAIDPRMVHYGFGEDDYEPVEVQVPFDELDAKGRPVLDADGKPEQVCETQTELRLKPGAEPSPQGVAYERFVVHHQLMIKSLLDRVAALESTVLAEACHSAPIVS